MIVLVAAAFGSEPGAPVETQVEAVRPADETPPVFSAFALFQARATLDDLASTNPLLDGQVVGRLGGTNGIVVDPTVRSAYTEQRFAPFLTWRPLALGGKAALTAAFEIDFAWGDEAYGTGGNVGGGFGADQVNLQTRRLHADFFPTVGNHAMHVVLGLQFVADSVTDPTATTPDGLFRSGAQLALFGSEASGISLYGRVTDAWGTRLKYRLGAYTLVEQGLSLPDDVLLAMADVELRPFGAAALGLHLYGIQDRSGATGVLGLGPTGSLWELQGGPSLDPYDGFPPPPEAPVDADVVWAMVDAGWNAQLDRGPVGVHGYAVANFGRVYAPIVHDDGISGAAVDVEARWRWARGDGSVVRVEAALGSGDDADPQRYTGIVTGNAWGIAAAPMPTHGTMLLFPDPRSVNRLVAVVSDLSGAGYGLLAASSSLGYDPIPSRLNVAAGAAFASTAAGQAWGTELNGRVSGRPMPGLDVSARAAVLMPGVAATAISPEAFEGRPWMVALGVDWLLF